MPDKPTPKASAEDKALFPALVPDDERVSLRPMFGSICAFANGYMFMGLFASELFVRLSATDEAEVAAMGGGPLEPMPGKPMKGYITMPNWRDNKDAVREFGEKSLDYTMTLPPKKK